MESVEKNISNIKVLSYTEFLILCVSGPAFFLLSVFISFILPTTLLEPYAVEITVGLQGALIMFFVLRRNPDLEAKMTGGGMSSLRLRVQLYAVKFFGAVATTVGSAILVWFPLYSLLGYLFNF